MLPGLKTLGKLKSQSPEPHQALFPQPVSRILKLLRVPEDCFESVPILRKSLSAVEVEFVKGQGLIVWGLRIYSSVRKAAGWECIRIEVLG